MHRSIECRAPNFLFVCQILSKKIWAQKLFKNVKNAFLFRGMRCWTLLKRSSNLRESSRARICQRLRNPGNDSKESVPPAYVAWEKESIPELLKRFAHHEANIRGGKKLFTSSLNFCRDLTNIWFRKQINEYSQIIDDLHLTIYKLFILSSGLKGGYRSCLLGWDTRLV